MNRRHLNSSGRLQAGVTLISLMVGLLISLVAVLGLMSIYHNSLQVTTSATKSALNDSQLAGLLLRSAAAVQDAGYGISSAAFGTQAVAISGAALSAGGSAVTDATATSSTIASATLSGTSAAVGTSVNAVVWATLTGANTQCAGFYAPTTGGLTYLEPVNCTDATQFATLSWTSKPIASPPVANSAHPITFTFAQQTCSPYGITNTTASYSLTLATQNSLGVAVSSVQCLMNLH
jgi:Tfp pilus assembly protein PilV